MATTPLVEKQRQLALSFMLESLRLLYNQAPSSVFTPVHLEWNWTHEDRVDLDQYLERRRSANPTPEYRASQVETYPLNRNGYRVPMKYELIEYLQYRYPLWGPESAPESISLPQDVLREILVEEGLAGNLAFKNKLDSDWRPYVPYPQSDGRKTPPTLTPELDWAICIGGKWRPISIT